MRLRKIFSFAVRWVLLLATPGTVVAGALTWNQQKTCSVSGSRVFAIGGGRMIVGSSPATVTPDASAASVQKFMRTKSLWESTPDPLRVQSSITSRTEWTVAIPLWMPLAAFGLLGAATWSLHIAGARRRRAGMCACGYDRQGLAMDVACPECGVTPAKKPDRSPAPPPRPPGPPATSSA